MNVKKVFPFRFFVVTFLWSWLIWLPLVLAGNDIIPIHKDVLQAISTPVSVLAAFGPAAGALVSLHTLQGKGAVRKYLKTFFDLKFGWKVWLAIFAVLGLSSAIAWFIPEVWGEPRLSMMLPSFYIFPIYWLIMVLFGGGQEEIGWRGFILPFLEKRYGRWFGSGILGVVWAFWHIPLWFIPGTSQTYMNFAGFMMLTVGYSFFFSWVMKASDNRPMAGLVVHGTANAFLALFPTLIMAVGVPQPHFWIWASITLVIGVFFMVFSIKQHGYKP